MSPPDHAVPIENLLRHRAWVRSVARALVRGDQDADDLEQEAWLAAVRQPPPEDHAPKAWLGTVLRRTAAKLSLRDARRETRERHSAEGREASPASDVVAQAEMHERVVRSVLALPEPYRTTILRRFFEDLTPREIAARDGTPLETVRARLRRGLALLRSELRGSDARAWPVTLVALAGSGSGKAGGAVAAGVVLMTQAKTAVLAGLAIVVAVGIVFWAATRDAASAADHPGVVAPAERDGIDPIDAKAPKSAKGDPSIRPRPFDARSESEPAAAESQADAATGTFDVRVIWGDDHKPAAGIGLQVVEWGTRSGMWKLRDVRTGPEGTVRLTGVCPGEVGFYVDRGGGDTVAVKGGEKKEVVLEIPPAPTVAGTVVDSLGKPVAGADVWLSDYGNQTNGQVVSRCDAVGKFVLRCVTPIRWIAARAAGHAPSAAYAILEGKSGETIPFTLVLGGPAGSVRGTVLRSDASAVVGATVRVEPAGDQAAAGSVGAPPPPVLATTDDAGTFTIEGLPEGTNRIAVRIAGLASWSGHVDVKTGETTPIEVRLRRQAVVFGTIKLGSGEPAVAAEVLVGGYGDFLFSMTKTAADGSYRLDSLAPGRIEIRAVFRDVGKAVNALDAAEGEELRWDAVVEAGIAITGVVRDEQGRPLSGWMLQARSSAQRFEWSGGGTTDARGRFRIVNLPADQKSFRLSVFARGELGGDGVRAIVDDVAPGEDRTIVISPRGLGTIRGRVLGPKDEPVAAEVRLTTDRDVWTITRDADASTGRFSAGPIIPGTWRITIGRKTLGAIDLGERELAPGADLDLGDVRLPEPGTLVIDLAGAAQLADRVTYEIEQQFPNPPGKIAVWVPQFRAAHRDLPRPLAIGPGSYTIEISGSGLATRKENFEIVAGRETKVRIAVEEAEKK